jgi:16S rRNA processing protein RimM
MIVEERYEEDFEQVETVFIEIKGKQVPHFLESVRYGTDTLVKFEDVDDRDKAIIISAKPVFIRAEDIIPDDEREYELPESAFSYKEYEGFTLVDTENNVIGLIEEILELPQQEVAAITYQDREVLVPMTKHYIKNIDKINKSIVVDLPEGLLEL